MPKLVVIEMKSGLLYIFKALCFFIAIYYIHSTYDAIIKQLVTFKGVDYISNDSTYYAEIFRYIISGIVASYFATFGSKIKKVSKLNNDECEHRE